MAKKPDPNDPIWHQNPPNQVPDRVIPNKPGWNEQVNVPETEANPTKPKKKPSK
jgi:hypothetical protein